MSKLFEAISTLETNGSQQMVDSPFAGHLEKSKNEPQGQDAKKVFLAACLILLFAISVGIGTLFVSKKLAVKGLGKKGQKRIASLQKEIRPKNNGGEKKVVDSSPYVLLRQPEQLVQKGNGIHHAQKRKPVETKDGLKMVSGKLDGPKSLINIRPKGQEQKIAVTVQKMPPSEPRPIKNPFAPNPMVLNSRQKKLLYRAEALRKSGRYEQALSLYKKVWNTSHNPLVANNLAAILMEIGRYQEARKILQDALRTSPQDRDLKFNLKQVDLYLESDAALKIATSP